MEVPSPFAAAPKVIALSMKPNTWTCELALSYRLHILRTELTVAAERSASSTPAPCPYAVRTNTRRKLESNTSADPRAQAMMIYPAWSFFVITANSGLYPLGNVIHPEVAHTRKLRTPTR